MAAFHRCHGLCLGSVWRTCSGLSWRVLRAVFHRCQARDLVWQLCVRAGCSPVRLLKPRPWFRGTVLASSAGLVSEAPTPRRERSRPAAPTSDGGEGEGGEGGRVVEWVRGRTLARIQPPKPRARRRPGFLLQGRQPCFGESPIPDVVTSLTFACPGPRYQVSKSSLRCLLREGLSTVHQSHAVCGGLCCPCPRLFIPTALSNSSTAMDCASAVYGARAPYCAL